MDDAAKAIKDYVGPGATVKVNKAGDPIIMSADGTKKVRLDVNNPHGDTPHVHIEQKGKSGWDDAGPDHRYYPEGK